MLPRCVTVDDYFGATPDGWSYSGWGALLPCKSQPRQDTRNVSHTVKPLSAWHSMAWEQTCVAPAPLWPKVFLCGVNSVLCALVPVYMNGNGHYAVPYVVVSSPSDGAREQKIDLFGNHDDTDTDAWLQPNQPVGKEDLWTKTVLQAMENKMGGIYDYVCTTSDGKVWACYNSPGVCWGYPGGAISRTIPRTTSTVRQLLATPPLLMMKKQPWDEWGELHFQQLSIDGALGPSSFTKGVLSDVPSITVKPRSGQSGRGSGCMEMPPADLFLESMPTLQYKFGGQSTTFSDARVLNISATHMTLVLTATDSDNKTLEAILTNNSAFTPNMSRVGGAGALVQLPQSNRPVYAQRDGQSSTMHGANPLAILVGVRPDDEISWVAKAAFAVAGMACVSIVGLFFTAIGYVRNRLEQHKLPAK